MSEIKSASHAFAESISELATAEIKSTLDKTQKRCEDLIATVEEKVGALKSGVLAVKINEGEVKPLKSRASKLLPRLIVNAKIGRNTMLIGPAGCGKTTTAEQVADALGLEFGHVCLTAGASEAWLFGRQTPTGFVEGQFSKLYRDGGVFLADEFDAADANLLLSINTAIEKGHMYNPMNGEQIPRNKNFVLIAAANTNGKGANHVYTGRVRLDAATLERFIQIGVDYDSDLEADLNQNKSVKEFLWDLRIELKEKQFDEFVSTRQFINWQLQMNAGIEIDEIFESMIFNWSDAAKKIARDLFNGKKNEIKKTKAPEKAPEEKKASESEENKSEENKSEEKRGRGRPPGKHGPYKPRDAKFETKPDAKAETKPNSTKDLRELRDKLADKREKDAAKSAEGKAVEPTTSEELEAMRAEYARLKPENEKLKSPNLRPNRLPPETPLRADNQEMHERFSRGEL